jgi:hypothetical protein
MPPRVYGMKGNKRDEFRRESYDWLAANGGNSVFDGYPEPTESMWDSLPVINRHTFNPQRGDILIDRGVGPTDNQHTDYRVVCGVSSDLQGFVLKTRGSNFFRFISYTSTANLKSVPREWKKVVETVKPEPPVDKPCTQAPTDAFLSLIFSKLEEINLRLATLEEFIR